MSYSKPPLAPCFHTMVYVFPYCSLNSSHALLPLLCPQSVLCVCLHCCPVIGSSVPSLRPLGLQPPRLLRPWDFPGKSTGVGCHFLLQGIFLTQGLNPGLPNCRQTLYPLSHQGSPSIFVDSIYMC